MSQVETALGSRVVAVYPNHPSAEEALRRLVKEGFAMKDVSIVGRDFQVEEEPIGFVSARDFIGVGAGTGAWVGGLFGLLIGAAFLVLPGVGPRPFRLNARRLVRATDQTPLILLAIDDITAPRRAKAPAGK